MESKNTQKQLKLQDHPVISLVDAHVTIVHSSRQQQPNFSPKILGSTTDLNRLIKLATCIVIYMVQIQTLENK